MRGKFQSQKLKLFFFSEILFLYIYIYIYIKRISVEKFDIYKKVKLVTIVKGDPKALFSM